MARLDSPGLHQQGGEASPDSPRHCRQWPPRARAGRRSIMRRRVGREFAAAGHRRRSGQHHRHFRAKRPATSSVQRGELASPCPVRINRCPHRRPPRAENVRAAYAGPLRLAWWAVHVWSCRLQCGGCTPRPHYALFNLRILRADPAHASPCRGSPVSILSGQAGGCDVLDLKRVKEELTAGNTLIRSSTPVSPWPSVRFSTATHPPLISCAPLFRLPARPGQRFAVTLAIACCHLFTPSR